MAKNDSMTCANCAHRGGEDNDVCRRQERTIGRAVRAICKARGYFVSKWQRVTQQHSTPTSAWAAWLEER